MKSRYNVKAPITAFFDETCTVTLKIHIFNFLSVISGQADKIKHLKLKQQSKQLVL